MRNFLVILLICLAALGVRAVPPAGLQTAYLYTDKNSLSGVFSSFCQDHDGFIWIGTDRGLLRFDGNSYDIYRHDDNSQGSLSDSRVLDVMCDKKGRVWVATANGLNLYNSADDTFKPITIPSKNFLGYIISITEQPDGTVTFVVSGVGVYVINDKGADPVAVKYWSGSEEQSVNTIVAAPSGRLYMGSDNGALYEMAKNGKMTRYSVADGMYIKALSIEEDGNLLIAVYGMLFRFYTATGELRRLEADGLTAINNLSNSSGSGVYVVTAGRGVWNVTPGSDIVAECTGLHCPFIKIPSAVIGAAYSAPDGNLWLGCNYRGVVMVPARPMPFVYRKVSDYFPDYVGGLSAMGVWKGNVLIGIDKGRVAMVAPDGRLLLQTVIPGGGNITNIDVEGDTAIVSVAYDGVWQLDLHSGALSKMIDLPGIYTDLDVAPGHPGELFVAVHGMGIMRYDRATGQRTWLPVDPDGDQLTNPYTASLKRTPDDKIWIGLYGGIACYDLKTDQLLHINQQPFLEGATFSIEPCLTDNSVWAGTSHGLIHFDPEKGVIDKMTVSKMMSDDYVRNAVKYAREYYADQEDANAGDLKLFVNDYGLEGAGSTKVTSLINWINRWESDGVTKIDGIGTQMHVYYSTDPEAQARTEKGIVDMFEKLAATGKLIRITELDMGIKETDNWQEAGRKTETVSIEESKKMGEFYKFIIEKYFEIIPVDQQFGIGQWCITDAPADSSWKGGEPVGLWNLDYQRKPTYGGFVEGLLEFAK